MKKLTLTELLEYKNKYELSYSEQYDYVCRMINNGKIKPVKSAGTNGKTPALPAVYYIVEEKKDYSELVRELRYEISSQISIDYYLKHLGIYEKERKWVLLLNDFLKERESVLNNEKQISINERSFEIWNREKFLQKEKRKYVQTQTAGLC